MRIIAGIFKGKKILGPNDKETRPLKDLSKESIFNIINHSNKFSVNLEGSNVLDLFSGTGSFGLECLSRKARHVTFVENYKKILPILKKNLFNLKSTNNYKIIEVDILKNLKMNNLKQKFDIIFLDPPYIINDLNRLLISIKKIKLIKKNGIIIIHRHRAQKDEFPNFFKIIEEKVYGISKIIFGNLYLD
tara:strand:+ start:74 stop:643 length:570 start_codon:yes stop_codon:yes gene_type:complete